VVRQAENGDRLALQRWLDPTSAEEIYVQDDSNVIEWVALYRNRVVGFVQLVFDESPGAVEKEYWLFSLIIKPANRRWGIGTALTKAVIDRACTEGAKAVHLLVFEDNIRAIRLYQKLGFEFCSVPKLKFILEKERIKYDHGRVCNAEKIWCKCIANH
jgi:ribosomal protein S18 acetylase RimI-like enzyme